MFFKGFDQSRFQYIFQFIFVKRGSHKMLLHFIAPKLTLLLG